MSSDAAGLETPAALLPKRNLLSREHLPTALLLAYLLLLIGYAHLGAEGLYERDGYFHARYAAMFFERGLAREFPWTQASTWKDEFCDKEFLYHALMAPWVLGQSEPIRGAQCFQILLGFGVCLAFAALLRAHHAPWPAFFLALLAATGGQFLLRIVMIRSHVLSVILVLVGLHLLIGRRRWALAILGFVYAWSYTFPLVLVMLAVPFSLGQWLGTRKLDWKSPAAAACGVALGTLVHPYSPYTLEMFLTILDILKSGFAGREAAVLEVGEEFQSYSIGTFFLAYPLLLPMGLCLGAAAWRLWKHLAPETLGVTVAALAWIALTLVFSRFAEYGVPLAVFALALVVRDRQRMPDQAPFFPGWRRRTCLWLGVAGLHGFAAWFALSQIAHAEPPRFQGAAAWMEKNLAPGETVVNLWWDDFPDLFYSGFRQHYVWGIDPTFTLRHDQRHGEEKARLLEEMRNGRQTLDGAKLAQVFQSRYMIMRLRVARLYLDTIRGVTPVYLDKQALIVALAEAEGATGPAP